MEFVKDEHLSSRRGLMKDDVEMHHGKGRIWLFSSLARTKEEKFIFAAQNVHVSVFFSLSFMSPSTLSVTGQKDKEQRGDHYFLDGET